MQRFASMIALIACCALPHRAAAVVVRGAIETPYQDGVLSVELPFPFSVRQIPEQTDHEHGTVAWLSYDHQPYPPYVTFSNGTVILDEGSDWYFVRKGDRFDAELIATNDYPQIVGYHGETGRFESNTVTFSPALDQYYGLEDGPNDFYLGVATSYGASAFPRTAFGWAKFEILNPDSHIDALRLVDSAMSYGAGIVVGTYTAIPEPSGLSIAIGGGFAGFFVRRRRKMDARSGTASDPPPRVHSGEMHV